MSKWTSRTPPPPVDGLAPIRAMPDGRLVVLDNRGFWVTVNINKSVPSWQKTEGRKP